MVISVYLPLVCAAFLALVSRPLVRWSPPALAARVLTVASCVIAFGTLWAVALLVVLRLCFEPLVARGGHLALPVLADVAPVPAIVRQLAAVVFAGMLAASVIVAWRRARATRRLSSLAAQCRAAGDLVVLDTAQPLAFALPGRDGRIVVSSAMLQRLDGPGRAVLLAHERTHLVERHDRFRAMTAAAAAVNPLLVIVAGRVDFALERWADEEAARKVGDRRLVAATLITAALGNAPASRPGFAFGNDDILERVRALHHERGSIRRTLVFPCVLTAIVCLAAAGDATGALARLLLAAHT